MAGKIIMKMKPGICAGLLGGVMLLTLLPAACGPNQSGAGPSLSVTPSLPPKKDNPKLDSQLNQLVAAQAKGEVITFAQQANIPLTNGSVRVIIECVAGPLK